MSADPKIIAKAMLAVGRTFTGGALENRGDAPMGKGHDNDKQPFDIETACYLKPVFEAYDKAVKNGIRTEIVLLAGVKTMKSFALEICCADHVCNRNGDAGLFFGSGDVADTVSTTRIMADYHGIRRFAQKLKSIPNEAGMARFKITNGAVKFPDKTFFLLPANLNELQQKNLGFAGMQDAFVTGATGVIEEMIARTTQYRDAIVFLESQGGETNFDHDRHYKNTNQGELHVICPHCIRPHVFNWKAWDESSMARPDDFAPTPPKIIPSLDHQAWIEHNRPILAGKVAGFQRGDEKIIKRETGEYIESAIIEETHFQCYFCGGRWNDDGEFGPTRIHLDRTSHYVSANPDALPTKIGINFPQWINRRLTVERKSGWGHMMLAKLQAQKVFSARGNVEPLKIWWQKVAARTWDEDVLKGNRIRRNDAYDVALAKHDAWRLCMIVDNQLDLMTQWAMVLAVKKNGSIKQLWRGALHGLDEVRKKQMEYVSAEGKPLIKDQFVFLDGRYKGELICRHIVEHKYGHWATMDGERVWLAWNLMMGSSYEYFSHADEKDKSRKFVCGDPTIRNFQLDGNNVEIWSFPFSATVCGQRFEGLRDLSPAPGEDRLLSFLERMPEEPADDNELSHHAMIHSNKLVPSKSYAPRMAKMHYVPVPASAPDHYFHMWRMAMAVLEIWCVDGIFSPNSEAPTMSA